MLAPAPPVTAALAVAEALPDLVSSSDRGVCEPPSARTVITPIAIKMADAAAPPESASIRPLRRPSSSTPQKAAPKATVTSTAGMSCS